MKGFVPEPVLKQKHKVHTYTLYLNMVDYKKHQLCRKIKIEKKKINFCMFAVWRSKKDIRGLISFLKVHVTQKWSIVKCYAES